MKNPRFETIDTGITRIHYTNRHGVTTTSLYGCVTLNKKKVFKESVPDTPDNLVKLKAKREAFKEQLMDNGR